jgi:uncharacterized membrane protein YkgB
MKVEAIAMLHLPTFDVDLERRIEQRLPRDWQRRIDAVDSAVARFMERYGVTILRIALAVVFIWFGALKIAGRSPVEDLVADTAYWLPAEPFVRFLGFWEVVVGIGLLIPVALRLTLLLFWLQMAGTLLVLVMHPDLAFQDNNPLLLTVLGEFVIKNLVLIAAGMVVGSSARRRREDVAPAGARS